MVEGLYREDRLDVSTITLLAGVNLPARSVIIADTHIYTRDGFQLDINNWLQSVLNIFQEICDFHARITLNVKQNRSIDTLRPLRKETEAGSS
ncbi:MAG: hypothetical protein VR67_11710 [Peptococcaceae bacterium BRH_c8a]|nr:MAG: hypothetical protein VR67_11710 [Peptococcaceae bacterium BRH_c8a]